MKPVRYRGGALVAALAALAMVLSGCGTAPDTQPPAASSAGAATGSPAAGATPSPSSPAAPPSATCTTASALAGWSLTRLAEQTVVVPVDESDVSRVTAEVQAGAGGIILFGSKTPTGFKTALSQLVGKAPGGIAPFVMTDEEGGAVQRMPNVVGTIPSARTMAATMTPDQIKSLALQVGRKMKATGVTMDLAPVLDLDGGTGPNSHNPDGTRSFSPVEKTATASGLAFATGLEQAGVVPVVKHFPGLGGATGNTDNVSASTLSWQNLQSNGLLPFKAAIRDSHPAIMIANAKVPGLTTLPASISSTVITTVLRRQLGFDGLVMTDSLSATAISAAGYTVPKATVAALRAGADMVLFNGAASTVASLTNQTVQAIVSAVGSGQLSRARLEDAVRHILTAKHVNLCKASA